MALTRLGQVPGLQGPPLPHLSQHILDVLGMILLESDQPFPAQTLVHTPSKQTVMLGGDQRRFVAPVLEHLSRSPEPAVECIPVVEPKPGEEGHEMGPAEHIHGVELDKPDPTHNLAEVTDIDTAPRPSLGQTLGGERISPCLTAADPSHRTATLTGVPSSHP